jgi:hypothetical protein
MSKPAKSATCEACNKSFASVVHSGNRIDSHEFVTEAAAKAVIDKIETLWFENVEFSRTTPLGWADFLAGFSAIEKMIWGNKG